MKAGEVLYQFRRSHGEPVPVSAELLFALRVFSECYKIIRRSQTGEQWLRTGAATPNGRALIKLVASLVADIERLRQQHDLLMDAYWAQLGRPDMVRRARRLRSSKAADALGRVRTDLESLFGRLDALAKLATPDCEARDRACAALLAGTAQPNEAAAQVIASGAA